MKMLLDPSLCVVKCPFDCSLTHSLTLGKDDEKFLCVCQSIERGGQQESDTSLAQRNEVYLP